MSHSSESACGYQEAHRRIYKARGAARDWFCIQCGRRAEQWGYRAGSPRELRGEVAVQRRSGNRGTSQMAWSPDPSDYDPLCRDCHGHNTRPDYKSGYRALSAEEQAARKREWRRASHVRQMSTPEGREAYRARKRRESTARASRRTDSHHTPAPPTPKEN